MTLKTNILLTVLAVLISTAVTGQDGTDGEFIEHTVKWYEDISSISSRYGVPEDIIIYVNKLPGKTVRTRQKLMIPTDVGKWEARKKASDREASATPADENAEQLAQPDTAGLRDTVRFALLLPLLNNDGSCNENNMDFYSGVLMGVKKAGEEGIDVVLNVFDFNDGLENCHGLEENDFIIGPIRSDDIEKTLAHLQDSTIMVISPLDAKASRLSDNRLVQACATPARQYDEAVLWALETGRKYPVVRYLIVGGDNDSLSFNSAVEAFGRTGKEYSVCTTGVQGEIIGWEENSLRADVGHNIVLLAISNEATLNNAVRNMSIYTSEGNTTVLTGSKIRSYETIPEENIHKTGLHAVCPYYVDYSDSLTLSFIHKYRPLFNNEPSQFSFQGYDLAYVALHLYSEYGSAWMDKAQESPEFQMLQTNFRFARNADSGNFENIGMRRIVYMPDFSIRLEKRD